MTADKTGAPTEVSSQSDRFSIAVDGRTVGHAAFIDHDTGNGVQRIFWHTEVDDEFGGRGLATILVREALEVTRAAGLRIVAVCPMVAAFIEKSHEFDDVADPVSRDVERVLSRR